MPTGRDDLGTANPSTAKEKWISFRAGLRWHARSSRRPRCGFGGGRGLSVRHGAAGVTRRHAGRMMPAQSHPPGTGEVCALRRREGAAGSKRLLGHSHAGSTRSPQVAGGSWKYPEYRTITCRRGVWTRAPRRRLRLTASTSSFEQLVPGKIRGLGGPTATSRPGSEAAATAPGPGRRSSKKTTRLLEPCRRSRRMQTEAVA